MNEALEYMNQFTNLEFQYQKLLKVLEEFVDKKKVIAALDLAKKAHQNQKRDEGQDYFIHPVRIANCFIFELGNRDSDLIIAGILHDVVEDSEVTLEEIKKQFGNRVAEIVGKLTRDKNKESKKEKFEKTMRENDEVRLVKAVDWLDNIRSYPYRTDKGERFARHICEISEMNLPMAESVNSYIASEMKEVLEVLPKPEEVL